MQAGTVIGGLIAFFLGAVGLLQLQGYAVLPFDLAVVSAYLTELGAFVLFGAITLVGIGLIVAGIAAKDGKLTVEEVQRLGLTGKDRLVVTQPPVVVADRQAELQRNPPMTSYAALSDVEVAILRYLSQGRDADDIAKITGLDRSLVSEKIAALYARGYITERHTLTEKGFEALRIADAQQTTPKPAT